MHLSVAITFFFRRSRLKYLKKICTAHQELNVKHTTTVITNTNNIHELNLIRENILNVDHHIITPSYLGHPYLLTWSHRDVFKQQISEATSHTHFLYTEDDLLFTQDNLRYWLHARNKIRSSPFIPGFLRYEINSDGEKVSTDITNPQELDSTPLVKVGNYIYANLKQPYQGMYLLDKKLATEFLFSDASSPDTGIWNIREKAAQGLTYWNVPTGAHSRIVVGLNKEYQVHRDAHIHHLPNNYAGNSDSAHGKLHVDKILHIRNEKTKRKIN